MSPESRPRQRLPRAVREQAANGVAAMYGGIAHRAELRKVGVTRADVRTEVAAGRWHTAGRHTVVVFGAALAGREPGDGPRDDSYIGLTGEAVWWRALWEVGSGACLDGVAALLASGMTGFSTDRVDVSMPRNNRRRKVTGVTRHLRLVMPPVVGAGIPRVRPERAMLHAAQWAASDRQAALLLCLPVQQRLVLPERVMRAWRDLPRGPRHDFLAAVVMDVCAGAQSLGELDFAGLCRGHGLPEPSRQLVRTSPGGRVYLDVAWEGVKLVVEIDGGHHALALNPVDDALRQNEVVLGGEPVLRIPVIGLRLMPAEFMVQVVRGHSQGRASDAA